MTVKKKKVPWLFGESEKRRERAEDGFVRGLGRVTDKSLLGPRSGGEKKKENNLKFACVFCSRQTKALS